MEEVNPKAALVMYKFLSELGGKLMPLQKKLHNFIPTVCYWADRAKENLDSVKTKRKFMKEIFKREAEIMMVHYTMKSKGKSPAAKKYKAQL